MGTLAAVIMAAGAGSRYEGNYKLLEMIDGSPLIRQTAVHALAAGYNEVVVVVGSHGNEVRDALDGLSLCIVENGDWEQGQSTSMKCGMRALHSKPDGIAFILGDQPFVTPETLQKISRTAEMYPEMIIVPTYKGRRGNPCVFPASVFDDLKEAEGDRGGRDVLKNHGKLCIAVDDVGILRDVDHHGDLTKSFEP